MASYALQFGLTWVLGRNMRTPATLFFLALSLLGALLFPACAADPMSTSADLLEGELVRLSGDGARNCSLIALGASPEAGWTCAIAADKAKQPFWLALQQDSIDSVAWIAIGRDSQRQRYYLVYDSSPYGRPGLHPRFTRDLCPAEGSFDPGRGDLGCRGIAP